MKCDELERIKNKLVKVCDVIRRFEVDVISIEHKSVDLIYDDVDILIKLTPNNFKRRYLTFRNNKRLDKHLLLFGITPLYVSNNIIYFTYVHEETEFRVNLTFYTEYPLERNEMKYEGDRFIEDTKLLNMI